jgi:hypothetical protein
VFSAGNSHREKNNNNNKTKHNSDHFCSNPHLFCRPHEPYSTCKDWTQCLTSEIYLPHFIHTRYTKCACKLDKGVPSIMSSTNSQVLWAPQIPKYCKLHKFPSIVSSTNSQVLRAPQILKHCELHKFSQVLWAPQIPKYCELHKWTLPEWPRFIGWRLFYF